METNTLELSYIEDDTLKATVSEVFQRLPQPVTEDLKDVVQEMLADSWHDLLLQEGGEAGNTCCVNDQYPEVLKYRICLSRKLPSEAARIFVVAHELAHAYLRHPTFLVRINELRQYITLGKEVHMVIEDQADFQVCLWGFREELLAFHRDHPEARKPTFFDQLPEWKL